MIFSYPQRRRPQTMAGTGDRRRCLMLVRNIR